MIKLCGGNKIAVCFGQSMGLCGKAAQSLRWIVVVLVVVDRVSIIRTDDSDSSSCDEEFWTAMEPGFDGELFTPGTTEYTDILALLSINPPLPGRKKRQIGQWCAGGYYLRHSPDGDACCQTIRATCMWYSPIADPTGGGGDDGGSDGGGQLMFPIWKATVHPDFSITVRYQYFFDVKCNSLENIYPGLDSICFSCLPLPHERKMLLASVPPTFINPTLPGEYGHSALMVGQTRFEPFLETLYCACVV